MAEDCMKCGVPLDYIPFKRCRTHEEYARHRAAVEESEAFRSRLDVSALDGVENMDDLKEWLKEHVLPKLPD